MRIDEPRWPSPGAGGGGVSNILREMFIMGVDNLTREDRGGRAQGWAVIFNGRCLLWVLII